ncbi:MAG TPA: hypothetical protein VMT16_05300 [Thermoanaerobaculia bacterium]|nr:hypothetical protein [Thermoanaerobaculia bacterium]
MVAERAITFPDPWRQALARLGRGTFLPVGATGCSPNSGRRRRRSGPDGEELGR